MLETETSKIKFNNNTFIRMFKDFLHFTKFCTE